jgi:hypothetical protein
VGGLGAPDGSLLRRSVPLWRWRRIDLAIVAVLAVVVAFVLQLWPSGTTQWTQVSLPQTAKGSIEKVACSHEGECLLASVNGPLLVSRGWGSAWQVVNPGMAATEFTIGTVWTDSWCLAATGSFATSNSPMTIYELRPGTKSVLRTQTVRARGQTFSSSSSLSATCTPTGSFCMLLTEGVDQPGGSDDSTTTTTWAASTEHPRGGDIGDFSPVSKVSPVSSGGNQPLEPACASPRNCLAVGDGTGGPWVTSTGGTHWRQLPWGPRRAAATSVACGASNSCVVGTANGTVYFTTPSGVVVRRGDIPDANDSSNSLGVFSLSLLVSHGMHRSDGRASWTITH